MCKAADLIYRKGYIKSTASKVATLIYKGYFKATVCKAADLIYGKDYIISTVCKAEVRI